MTVPECWNSMISSTLLQPRATARRRVTAKPTKFNKPNQGSKEAGSNAKQGTDSEAGSEQNPPASAGHSFTGVCHRCGVKGHYARNCRTYKAKPEAPGKAAPSDDAKPKAANVKAIRSVPVDDEYTESQLEDMLAKCRLRNKQKQLEDAHASARAVTANARERG